MNNYIANLGNTSILIKQIGTRWYAFPIGGGTCLYQGRCHTELWFYINAAQAAPYPEKEK
jgi:hypothetical protein